MNMEPIMQIGKSEVTPELVKAADEALEARELIKIHVLKNCFADLREIANTLAERTRSQVVQVIGTKFVLYRPSHNKEKKDKIVLCKPTKGS